MAIDFHDRLLYLRELCQKASFIPFPLRSRVHKLRDLDLYVKRDDELSFGISGSKLRKYLSLIPILKAQPLPVALVGSIHSNHILGLLQLLKQQGIEYRVFLQRPTNSIKEGNAFYLSILLKEGEVIWCEAQDLPHTSSLQKSYEESLNQAFYWIPMGGCMAESLLGAMTLAIDLIDNQNEMSLDFDQIFVDAGTGMSAAALIIALGFLGSQASVYVTLVAGSELEFQKTLSFLKKSFEDQVNTSFSLPSFKFLYPLTARSFGSTNASVFREIKFCAEREGLFLDPIYTAKVFPALRAELSTNRVRGKSIWVHSGGALSLSGFSRSKLKTLLI